jgi:hypothetical protein
MTSSKNDKQLSISRGFEWKQVKKWSSFYVNNKAECGVLTCDERPGML